MTPTESEPLGRVVGIGVLLILAGAGLGVWAIAFDVSAPAEMMLETDRLFPQRVANADLMAQRGMIALAAAANYVSGWIVVVGGLALREMKGRSA